MALKRIPQHTRIRLPSVRLWLDDLEELDEILTSGGTSDVMIEADGRIADIVDDLTDLPKQRATRLKLTRVGQLGLPELTVETFRYALVISTTESGDVMRGLAHSAADFLRPRQRPRITRPAVAFTVMLVGLALGVTGTVLQVLGDSPAVLAAVLLGAALTWTGLLLLRLGRTVVTTRRQADSPGFFERNKDAIGVAVLSSLASGMIGFILGKLS